MRRTLGARVLVFALRCAWGPDPLGRDKKQSEHMACARSGYAVRYSPVNR